MESTYLLNTPEQLEQISNPLKRKLLEVFGRRPMTTKQVAEELGERPTKLYRYVEQLYTAKLIRLVATKQKRGATEKYFEAVAARFSVDRKLLALIDHERESPLLGLFSGAFDKTMAELARSTSGGLIAAAGSTPALVFTHTHISATKEQIADLMAKLEAWLDECRKVAKQSGGEQHYGLTMAFFPTVGACQVERPSDSGTVLNGISAG